MVLENTCYALTWASYLLNFKTMLITRMDCWSISLKSHPLSGHTTTWQMLLSELDIACVYIYLWKMFDAYKGIYVIAKRKRRVQKLCALHVTMWTLDICPFLFVAIYSCKTFSYIYNCIFTCISTYLP